MIKKFFKTLNIKIGLLQRFAFRNDKIHKKVAFTLAEVLITLGIIGVVAAMTIPTLIQKQQEKANVVKLQKAYSVLSQAYQYAVEEYGVPSTWGVTERSINESIIIRNNLLSKVKLLNKCDNFNNFVLCGFPDKIYYLNGSGEHHLSRDNKNFMTSVRTADNLSIAILSNGDTEDTGILKRGSGALKYCLAFIIVDLNGNKKPNTYGKDIFHFWLTNEGIVPAGTQNSNANSSFGAGDANYTAWVIQQKNMKYLHSDKCSWENTSCK